MYYQGVVVNVEDEDILPGEYKLEQNYPNPFNPSTVIRFAVKEKSNVLIKIYDILGGEIITIVNEELDAGWHRRISVQVDMHPEYLFIGCRLVATLLQKKMRYLNRVLNN